MGGGVFMGWGGPDLKGGALRSQTADFLAIEVKRFLPAGEAQTTKRFFIPAKPERSASAALKASSEA